MKKGLWGAAAAILLVAGQEAAPAQIVSYQGSGTTNLALGSANNTNLYRAIGFTIGASDVTAGSLTLSLAFSSSLTSTDFTVSLYSQAQSFVAGSKSPVTTASLMETFTNPTFSFNSNNSSGSTPTYTSYTFTLATPETLTAGSTYWIVLNDADTIAAPSSQIAVYVSGYTAGTAGGTGASLPVLFGSAGSLYGTSLSTMDMASGNTPTFSLNAAPEPSSGALLGGGLAGFAVLVWLRRRAETARG